MEKVKCPNPKCGRRIFDIEEMPPGKVVLEMKCRHCGEIVQVGISPKKIHKKNRRQGVTQHFVVDGKSILFSTV